MLQKCTQANVILQLIQNVAVVNVSVGFHNAKPVCTMYACS